MNQSDANTLLELKREFEVKKNKEYEIKSIVDSVVYSKKLTSQLPDLYYLIL